MRDWSFYLVNFCLPPTVWAHFFPAQSHLLQPAEVVLFFFLGFCSWEVSIGWLSDCELDFAASEGAGAVREVLLGFSQSSGGSREGTESSPCCLCCLTGHHWAVQHCHLVTAVQDPPLLICSETNAFLCPGCSLTLLQLYPIKLCRHLSNLLAFTHSSCIFHFCFWTCISAHKILTQTELCLSCSLRSGVILILSLWQVQEVSVKEQNSLSDSLVS